MQLLQQGVHCPLAFVEGARDQAQGLGDRPDRNEGLQSIGVENAEREASALQAQLVGAVSLARAVDSASLYLLSET